MSPSLSRRSHRLRSGLAVLGLAALMTPLTFVSGTSAAAESSAAVTPNAKPVVVPALQHWTGGEGRLTLGRSTAIVVSPDDAAVLTPVARQLRDDMAEVVGFAPRIVSTGQSRGGDIRLDVSPSAEVGADTDVARKEGYSLDIDETVTIAARTPKAVYWGTRSLLQAAMRETGTSASVARGRAVDWPNYASRGFMLDVGRRWFGEEFIRDYVRYMSWFKLNTFQIHLNDNEIHPAGGDWSQAQSAFRLKSDDPQYAGLAAEDGAFTRESWDRLEDVAAAHHVMIVPEIDAPAHARAFIEFKPELGLNGGNSDHLDLSKPATTEFMKSVFDEFTPWFRGPVVHFGADEYPRAFADDYKRYFNDIAAHIRAAGKQPMAWGSFTVMSGTSAGYDKDVLINSWNNGWYSPKQAVTDGYRVTNTNDGLLYIVPFANYYNGRGLPGQSLFTNWEPHVAGSASVPAQHPLLDGAMSAVWNDLVHAEYDGPDVHGLVEPTFGLLAQKMWRGVEPGQTYDQFMAGVSKLGVGPGMEGLSTTLFSPGDESLESNVQGPSVISAGESADVTLTVRNESANRVSQTSATLSLITAGLTVEPIAVGPGRIEPGQEATWTWRVTAPVDAGYSSVKAVARLDGQRSGIPVFSARQLSLRTVAPAPTGLEHLSYDATATASSVEANLERLGAPKVNDGDVASRWASNYTDAEWVQLELPAPATVEQVQLQWEAACALAYKIQVSSDGITWADAADVTSSSCQTDTVDLNAPDPVRFVRMQGVDRRTSYGYSIFEFRVFGTRAG